MHVLDTFLSWNKRRRVLLRSLEFWLGELQSSRQQISILERIAADEVNDRLPYEKGADIMTMVRALLQTKSSDCIKVCDSSGSIS